jgi:hypothetical protein
MPIGIRLRDKIHKLWEQSHEARSSPLTLHEDILDFFGNLEL